MPPRLPKLPDLLDRKIYKTGQTRGADDDEIYQNRVSRSSTVLIPFSSWNGGSIVPNDGFTMGFIVLLSPEDYFVNNLLKMEKTDNPLILGQNALVFYETRVQWERFNPDDLGWHPAEQRIPPLRGNFIARIPATTAIEGGGRISRGFNTTRCKGAGIRVFEYASKNTIKMCRLQLEALFWLCFDSNETALKYGMTNDNINIRKGFCLTSCKDQGLLDFSRLIKSRVINREHKTICPLCLEPLSSMGFFDKMEQAAGREVQDLTVTQLNLFHIDELRIGEYNHTPYNLGWGHHHCNVVTRDIGIEDTLSWMIVIIERNKEWEKSDEV